MMPAFFVGLSPWKSILVASKPTVLRENDVLKKKVKQLDAGSSCLVCMHMCAHMCMCVHTANGHHINKLSQGVKILQIIRFERSG
jgi:hypothetical protein